jgi:RHS repeat-associated protein
LNSAVVAGLVARLPVVVVAADVVDADVMVGVWAASIGQTQDQTTGLMYYRARYYDPAVGRFISADTIVPDYSDPQSLNRYSYVNNRPLRLVDPTGHDGCAPPTMIEVMTGTYDSDMACIYADGQYFTVTQEEETAYHRAQQEGPNSALVVDAILETLHDAGYDRTKYAGLVREIVDDVPRWAAPESDVIFTIDTSRLPVLKDLDSEVLGKIATKVRFLGTSARWAGVGFAFVSDWGDYKAGYQEGDCHFFRVNGVAVGHLTCWAMRSP